MAHQRPALFGHVFHGVDVEHVRCAVTGGQREGGGVVIISERDLDGLRRAIGDAEQDDSGEQPPQG